MYNFIDIICGNRCTTVPDEEVSQAEKCSSEEAKPTVQEDDKPTTSQENVTNGTATEAAVETVDPMDTKNYLVVQLTKPMGILFRENYNNKYGGAFVASMNEGRSAAEDGSINEGDQLIAVGVERVSGIDFGDVINVIEKNEVGIKLILFRGSAENLYGASGATIEWLDEFIAERGRGDVVAAEEQPLQEDESPDKQDLQQDDADKSPDADADEDVVAAEEQPLQEDEDESPDKQDLQQDDADKSPDANADEDNAEEVDKFDEVTAAVRDTVKAIEDAKDCGVVITNINFDSKEERSATNEYVEIRNTSESDVDISGYSVEDTDANGKIEAEYSFPANTVLKAGESTRIYTNEYHPESGGHSFGSGCGMGNDFGATIVWNNVGGVAVLKNADGDKIHEYSYEIVTKKTQKESEPVEVIKKADKGDIIISYINYDGQVKRTESDEYVEIANISESDVDISGCIVEDIGKGGKVDNMFQFPAATPVLKADESVKIYTNEYHEESGGHSFKSGSAMWNNARGVAILKNADGSKIHEYTYEGEDESEPVEVIKKADEGDIIISYINYDGQVKRTESDEYVEITNKSESDVDISGCIVEDIGKGGKVDNMFQFPAATPVLKAGESVMIYTNECHEESGGHSFKSGSAIWNNAGGVAVLKNSNEVKIDEYTYYCVGNFETTEIEDLDEDVEECDFGGVVISSINVYGSGKSQSDEYVEITNTLKSSVDISGYSVLDVNVNYVEKLSDGEFGLTFTFPESTVLEAGASVRIYTNEDHTDSGGYNFGSGKEVWNDMKGEAVLKDADGRKIGQFKYDEGGNATCFYKVFIQSDEKTKSVECVDKAVLKGKDTTNDEYVEKLRGRIADEEVETEFGCVVISSINIYGKEKSESDEYVKITNISKSPVDISGYSVEDVNSNYAEQLSNGGKGAKFTFPSDAPVLEAGKSVKIYSNEVHNDCGGYSFGCEKGIWYNMNGKAELKDAQGKKIGELSYDEGGNFTSLCYYEVCVKAGTGMNVEKVNANAGDSGISDEEISEAEEFVTPKSSLEIAPELNGTGAGVETNTSVENEDSEEGAEAEAEATNEDVEEYIGCLDDLEEEETDSLEAAAVVVNDDSDDFVDAVDKEEPSTSDIPEEPAMCEVGEEELLKLD